MPKKKTVKKVRARRRVASRSTAAMTRTEATALVREARRLLATLQRQAERIVDQVEARMQRIRKNLERRIAKAIEPTLAKILGSRRELEKMRGRLAALERQAKGLARRPTATAA